MVIIYSYVSLPEGIVFQNIVVDLQRGDEIYGCWWWIVAWAPSFATGWYAIPLWKNEQIKKVETAIIARCTWLTSWWRLGWFSIATLVDPGPFEGILGLGRPSFKAAGDPAVKASQPPDIADKCWLYPIYSAHCMEGFLNGTLPHHPSHDQFRNFQQPWYHGDGWGSMLGNPHMVLDQTGNMPLMFFLEGDLIMYFICRNSFGGINLPFPVMGGLWHCFTHINQNTTNFDQPRSIRPIPCSLWTMGLVFECQNDSLDHFSARKTSYTQLA